ncbi:sugar-binding protein [Georgenia satyanarayanai]|uniref:substrate-binding domain-containing protein n=1 Tax=Georgenia satyanarayanai TaxID=860221 RepID=UPI002041C290|nr:sugar-binding protein [Georgenia satyanarayanai]MCM3661449.1 sugar-binding protein [Georgenia satyanarayanai]
MTLSRRTARSLGLGALVVAVGLAGCAGADSETEAGEDAEVARVGVAMPTQEHQRWVSDGTNVAAQLKDLGHDVTLQYADDDPQVQADQIKAMIEDGADALVIGAVDGSALTDVLSAAGDIPVVSYDRLILDTPNVDYYATFDNERVGIQQGTSLLVGLGILNADGTENADGPEGPLSIELFAGSADDNNAGFFFNGAMDTLRPYLEDGTLVVPSGQTEFDAVATPGWSQEVAQERMTQLMSTTYAGGEDLHGVLSPFDGISRGIITAIQGAGRGPTIADGLPVVTGQDAESDSVVLVDDGVQLSTIFKDTRQLAEVAVSAVHKMLTGEEPETNDITTYDNGRLTVPAYLLAPQLVTQDNYQHLLIESGYYEAGDLA